MKLSEGQKQKVNNGLKSKIKNIKCPFCGNSTSFSINDGIYHIISLNDKLQLDTENITNCVVIKCANCGHIDLFDYPTITGERESSK